MTSIMPRDEPAPSTARVASGDPAIALEGVSRRFGEVTAVHGVELSIDLHRRIGIVGPSGGGKSTILNLVCGLEEPDDGTVTVLGRTSQTDRLASCALMPQKDLLLPWRNALDNACLALENRGMARRDAHARVAPLFERFGLQGFERRRPAQLSGGMRQRVSFLRTLVAGKEVLLLDEPFGSLDSITRAGMQEWLREALDSEPRTVMLVTHDVEEALLLCHEVVVLSARPGRVVRRLHVHLPAAARVDLIGMPEFIELKKGALEALEW
jgi:ABC-type nitrate/sulfonate/bicarbonate transport system ATPase subunit